MSKMTLSELRARFSADRASVEKTQETANESDSNVHVVAPVVVPPTKAVDKIALLADIARMKAKFTIVEEPSGAITDLVFQFGLNSGKTMKGISSNARGRSYLRWVHEGDFPETVKQVVREVLCEDASEIAMKHKRTEDA